MKTLKTTLICLLLAAASIVAFAGCHTANGFGKDMKDTGQKIENSTD